MAYARFSDTDVYVFGSADGWICMCCRLTEINGGWYGDRTFPTRAATIAHMQEHEREGHETGGAIPRLKREISSLEKREVSVFLARHVAGVPRDLEHGTAHAWMTWPDLVAGSPFRSFYERHFPDGIAHLCPSAIQA